MIVEVLGHIEAYNLMPPLMVVQTLAESTCSTLSDIKVGGEELRAEEGLNFVCFSALHSEASARGQRTDSQGECLGVLFVASVVSVALWLLCVLSG